MKYFVRAGHRSHCVLGVAFLPVRQLVFLDNVLCLSVDTVALVENTDYGGGGEGGLKSKIITNDMNSGS